MNENNVPNNEVKAGGFAQKIRALAGNKKLLTFGGIGIAAVVVVALVSTVVASTLSTPVALVGKGISNSAEALGKNPAVELLTDVMDGGSAELTLGLETLFESIMGQGIDGSVSLKIYSDLGDAKAAAVAKLMLDDELFADASILAADKKVIVTSDVLLEGEAYGVDLEHAADNFEDSVFGPDGYLSIGIDSIDGYMEYMEMSETLREDGEKLAAELAKVLYKSLKEHAEITKDSDELTFAGESARVSVVEVVLDDEAFAAVMSDVVEYLQESETFEEFVDKYAQLLELQVMQEYNSSKYYYERYYDIYTYEQYCDYFYGGEIDYAEGIYDAIDELEDELEDFEEYAEFDKLTALFYVTKSGKELVGIDLKVKADGETVKAELRAGPTMKDLREISLRVVSEYETIIVSYEVETNDKAEYVAELTVKEDSYEVLSGEIEWDKKNGDISITLVEDGGSYFLEGSLEASSKDAVFKLEEIGEDGDTLELEAVLTLKTSDKMPDSPEEYEDFLELTNDDLEDLAADVAANLMDKYHDLDEDLMWILQMLMRYI